MVTFLVVADYQPRFSPMLRDVAAVALGLGHKNLSMFGQRFTKAL